MPWVYCRCWFTHDCRGQVRRVQLARADQDRRELAVDEVAVHGERGERVVRVDRLTTSHVRQRDVGAGSHKRMLLSVGVSALIGRVGDRGRGGEVVVLDLVEPEGRAGRLDVALDVRRLERVLVRD